MHMSRLTRRTQLLLDEERHERLERRSAETGRSVASIIREAIDSKLAEDEVRHQRREAGRRMLEAPLPREGSEPDWEDVKNDLYEERHRRWYPDDRP